MTFDVAIRLSFSLAVAILYHSHGSILRAWTQHSLTIDPLIGEVEATLLAVSSADALVISHLVLQGDSAEVIECLLSIKLAILSNGPALPWKIASLILLAHSLIVWFSLLSPLKIS